MRVGVAGVLGDGPTVLPWQVSEQTEHELACAMPGLDPGEPPRHRLEQPVCFGFPTTSYAMAYGHRLIFRCPHN